MVISLMLGFWSPYTWASSGGVGASVNSGLRGWPHHFNDKAPSKARDGIELQWMQHFPFLKNSCQIALVR